VCHKLNYGLFKKAEVLMKRQSEDLTPTGSLTILRRSRQHYPGHPDEARLEAFPNPRPGRVYWIHFECPEFTSICPVTAQPDFALIAIDYVPGRLCLESKSLKLYLDSFRNLGVFYEAAVNRIADDITKACRPRRLKVSGKFNPRGGIAMTVSVELFARKNARAG